ncbi:hypothetical protein [Hydrogenophaga sp.]|uniref:hypothetical protein n=1 Tax=Hydrogenophaga sp. TaxID=1904254 RepID=UPI0035B24108
MSHDASPVSMPEPATPAAPAAKQPDVSAGSTPAVKAAKRPARKTTKLAEPPPAVGKKKGKDKAEPTKTDARAKGPRAKVSANVEKAPAVRARKVKMVRDSFTFPEPEHKRLVEMKRRLIDLGKEVKKGELVRAGLGVLAAMDNAQLLKAVALVDKVKTGRPKK